MVDKTISRIEDRIRGNESLSGEKKQEMLSLIGDLRSEIAGLEKTHHNDARSIAGYTETSVHEATRDDRNPELLKHTLDGLSLSVRRFEVSHSRLTGLINNIGQTLWKLGI
jgi:Mg2+ and Co2+ transporter CorA